MTRFLRLALLAMLSSGIVFWLADKTSWRIETSSFLAGLGAAALAEFFRFNIANWWSAMTQPYKPQVVRQETRETPDDVVSAASGAALLGGLIFAGLVLLLLLALDLVSHQPIVLLTPLAILVIAVIFLPFMAKLSIKPKTK